MQTILVPTDFSEEAGHALNLATDLAKKSNSKIILFHIVESPIHVYNSYLGNIAGNKLIEQDKQQEAYVAAMLVIATRQLEETAQKVEGVEVDTYIQVGHFYKNIAETITSKEVDLIVMGSQGASSLEEEYVGSNTDKVIRFAKCPVISVKQAVSLADIQQVALPLTLVGDEPAHLIKAVADFQKLTDAHLHLVRVNHLGSVLPHRVIHTRMEKLAKTYQIENYTTHIYSEDDVETGILHFAEDNQMDMIMMGTHSRTGLARVLSRKASIAEDVATHTKLLVWTYTLYL
ncbi:MAG: universal stress protein [Thermonemataceae bacterium]